MFSKRNFVIISLLLLSICIVAIWLVGIGIDKTARRMHSSMLEDVGSYRADLIALDFRKTMDLGISIQEYVNEHPGKEKELQDLLRGMVRMDAKVTRIWYRNKEKEIVVVDSLGVRESDPLSEAALTKISEEMKQGREATLYHSDGISYWTFLQKMQDFIIGMDVSLAGLHTYFAEMRPRVRSYAYILNPEGIVLAHPDEGRVGRFLDHSEDELVFEKVRREGKTAHVLGFSNYLLLPVERVYYPISVGDERWVVVINVPEMITQEEMAGFRRYTLLIVAFTVVLFSILLAFSQYRWRKEYDRRRKLEQDTLQLNIQQLRNQINPHFLFNSLNSLSALINSAPLQAKEFVLNLSRIYRYVLEKRQESVVPVREEVMFIRHYYFLQKIRFQEQLKLEMYGGLEQEERMIPLMSLQMLVENAIKHNEITRQFPLHIRIYLKEKSVIVENSYRPRRDISEDSLGVGLENIRKIYDYCSEFQFTYKVEGDWFVCNLPLI